MNKKVEAIVWSVICFMLTIAIVIQIKTVNNNGTTVSSNQRESNLKTQVLKMKEKYENQYEELERKTKELEQARQQATNNNADLAELENKIKEYNTLVGNTDVTGTGITVTLNDGKIDNALIDPENLIVHAENVLAIVNELRNAGAEAISINGQRIVNTTAIPCDGNVVVINGTKVSTPIEISAIGLTEMLSTLNRAGGTLEYFEALGKSVELKKHSNVNIPKYSGVISFKYAKTVK